METDHKPLESIFKKSLLSAPCRLQRMLLRLQRYNLSVSYKPGSQMFLADHLSRAAQHEVTMPEESFQVFSLEVESLNPMQALKVTPGRLEQLQRCTGQDEALQTLKTTVLTGWPMQKEQVPVTIREYWSYREELTVYNGILFKGSRVVIPRVMKSDKEYLVLVDFYSDFIEVKQLQENTSSSVIEFLKEQFSRYGIPDTLVTDNCPQFTSHEFQQFSRDWEFVHVSSSPHHHRSNGKVESAVKVATSLLKKALKDNKDPWLAMLDERNTPTESLGLSPAQQLMCRRTRTRLPTATSLLNPKFPESVTEKLKLKRQKAKW